MKPVRIKSHTRPANDRAKAVEPSRKTRLRALADKIDRAAKKGRVGL